MVMVADEALSVGEVVQRIKEAMECPANMLVDLASVYPVPGHPTMWPDAGFVELVSLFSNLLPRLTLLYFCVLTARARSPALSLMTPTL
jgi:hypothetical protein